MITGASGQTGRALLRSVAPGVQLHPVSREELDISDEDTVLKFVSSLGPDLIINAAAYTAVDKAESEPERAVAANALGPKHLAEAARRIDGCRLLHISTDYVFDGCAAEPYQPNDLTNPLNVYGRTKLLGERAVLEILADRATVLRTAWVYASEGRNFLLTMLKLMRERGEVRVVADQSGAPTAAASIARALWRLADLPTVHGLLQWTDDGVTTWYGFACAIAEEGVSYGLLPKRPRVIPITTAEYPTAAHRPIRSVMDIKKSSAKLGLKPVPWRDSLRATLGELAAARGC